jgi:hypothetical protein
MKFLPAQPPAPVSGQTIQGGAAGPFVRSGRPPVDPRPPRGVRARGALSTGTKDYRYGSPTFRADWDASTAAGSTGTAKIGGGTVLSVVGATGYNPGAPVAGPIISPAISVLLADVVTGVQVDTPAPVVGVNAIVVSMSTQLVVGNAVPSRWSPVFFVWDGATHTPDMTARYAAWDGPLVLARWVSVRVYAIAGALRSFEASGLTQVSP